MLLYTGGGTGYIGQADRMLEHIYKQYSLLEGLELHVNYKEMKK